MEFELASSIRFCCENTSVKMSVLIESPSFPPFSGEKDTKF